MWLLLLPENKMSFISEGWRSMSLWHKNYFELKALNNTGARRVL